MGPTMRGIVARIRVLYEDGVALYTKNELKRVADQLVLYEEGGLKDNRVLVHDLNGRTIPVPVHGAPFFILPDGKKMIRKYVQIV
jgi:hypothetical protein